VTPKGRAGLSSPRGRGSPYACLAALTPRTCRRHPLDGRRQLNRTLPRFAASIARAAVSGSLISPMKIWSGLVRRAARTISLKSSEDGSAAAANPI